MTGSRRTVIASPDQIHDLRSYLQSLQPDRAAVYERWSVKTGADADVQAFVDSDPTPTTIASLGVLPVPQTLRSDGRSQGAEQTIWQVNAMLIRYSLDYNLGYRLMLGDDRGNTMIAVIPDLRHPT
jgi:hypothetical protein